MSKMPSDFTVWTYVYDISGLASVNLKYRTDKDGINSLLTTDNETYAGGNDVNAWQTISMTSKYITPTTNPMPTYKANEYDGQITGINNTLLDYYVEATDKKGNIGKSPIQHVWVGAASTGTTTSSVTWTPQNPTKNDTITITITGANTGRQTTLGIK